MSKYSSHGPKTIGPKDRKARKNRACSASFFRTFKRGHTAWKTNCLYAFGLSNRTVQRVNRTACLLSDLQTGHAAYKSSYLSALHLSFRPVVFPAIIR